jgi:hypothetical protein
LNSELRIIDKNIAVKRLAKHEKLSQQKSTQLGARLRSRCILPPKLEITVCEFNAARKPLLHIFLNSAVLLVARLFYCCLLCWDRRRRIVFRDVLRLRLRNGLMDENRGVRGRSRHDSCGGMSVRTLALLIKHFRDWQLGLSFELGASPENLASTWKTARRTLRINAQAACRRKPKAPGGAGTNC